MPEFARLQQNALNLTSRLERYFSKQQGCLNFFSVLIPNHSVLNDAYTIGLLASCLDEAHDKTLLLYIEKTHPDVFVNNKEFENFKFQVIWGIYLFKWLQYNSSVTTYLYKPLLDLFQLDLGMASPQDVDTYMIDESLKAFSLYCCYVYEQQHTSKLFNDLNSGLGPVIQVDIHKIRNSIFVQDSSFYGVYSTVMHTIGLDNMC